MAYYLTIDKNKKREILDITNSRLFERNSNLQGNRSTLEEIDLFTTKFSDEVALKKHLCEEKILDVEDIMKKISIRMASKGELAIVKNGPFYNYSNKYLEPEYLLMMILSKQDDNHFLEKLCSYYRNSYNNNETVYFIRNLKETRERYGNVEYVQNKLPSALCEFVRREVFDIDNRTGQIKTDNKTGEVKIKYKSLHDLAMFTFKYIDNEQMIVAGYTEEEIKEQTKKELEELQEQMQYNPKSLPKVRKRVRTEEEYGQMSLFSE